MEVGHAKVVEALFQLIAFLQTLDPLKYNPPNPSITVTALQDLYTAAVGLLADVSDARQQWRTDAKARALLIEKLPAIAASAVGVFAALGVDKERVEQARAILRKLQGVKVTPNIPDDPATPEDESAKNISASQQSAAQMIAHFRALIDFLTAQTEYALVKDAGLQTSDLTTLIDDVESKHETSIVSVAQLSSKLNARDTAFYSGANNICDRAGLVKEYVKGKYGTKSPEFQTINSIRFRRE